MKRIVTLIALITGLALVPVASASGCHAITTTPGYHDAYTSTIHVQVSRYLGMTCNRALRIGAAAYLATRSVGQFGFGDRPFHVGLLSCWLKARGSDFSVGACWHGHGHQREYVKFGDHRNY